MGSIEVQSFEQGFQEIEIRWILGSHMANNGLKISILIHDFPIVVTFSITLFGLQVGFKDVNWVECQHSDKGTRYSSSRVGKAAFYRGHDL